jgi:uncharacterized protein (TIGR03083 family)
MTRRPAPLPPESHLASIEAESARMASVARGDLSAPVPACPGWDVAKLLLHQGLVHRWVTGIVKEGGPPDGEMPRAPDGEARIDWLLDGAAALIRSLREAGPDRQVWTWVPETSRAGFWFRRMSQETMVHRRDAEDARGETTRIEPLLAADGIDEMWEARLAARGLAERPAPGLQGTMRLAPTDVDVEWTVRLSPGEVVLLDPEEAASLERGPDATLRASASMLLLFLWNRTSLEETEVWGDVSVPRRWAESVRI